MKTTVFFLLALLSVYSFCFAIDLPAPIENGKIAVTLVYDRIIDGIEFNSANLDRCLRNHLDYYLWHKGWDYEFVDNDTTVRDDFRYRLQMKVKASFKSKKIRSINGVDTRETKYGGFLKIETDISLVDLENNNRIIISRRRTKSETGKEWVRLADGSFMPPELAMIEPPDFVIKEHLSNALSFLPSYKPVTKKLKWDIPVYLVLDKRIRIRQKEFEDGDVYLALQYISRSLQRQFGFGLKVVELGDLTVDAVSFNGISGLFDRLLENEPFRRDTLTIAIFDPDLPEGFYERTRPSRIGVSDLGRQISLTARLAPPNPETSEWAAFLNGQLMLHEIGHLLGAIHVSDLNSIMNPTTAWVSSDLFDPLNYQIIKRGRGLGLPANSVGEYLNLITDCLDNSDYGLADYPEVFFSYISLNYFKLRYNSFGGGDSGRAVPYAVTGFQMYLLNRNKTARDNFYRALACDPDQASIHYYLSKTTDGRLSEYHLKKSAEMGFYKAINEITRLRQ